MRLLNFVLLVEKKGHMRCMLEVVRFFVVLWNPDCIWLKVGVSKPNRITDLTEKNEKTEPKKKLIKPIIFFF